MYTELVTVIDNLGLLVGLILVTLIAFTIILGLIANTLREIRDVLKDLVIETAYLATIEDDETEPK